MCIYSTSIRICRAYGAHAHNETSRQCMYATMKMSDNKTGKMKRSELKSRNTSETTTFHHPQQQQQQ